MYEVPSPLLKVEYTPLSLPILTLSCRSGLVPAPRWPLKLAVLSAVQPSFMVKGGIVTAWDSYKTILW